VFFSNAGYTMDRDGFWNGNAQMEQDGTVAEPSSHIVNMGRLVEDMENKIRHTLNEIYFGKTKDIVNGLRSIQPIPETKQQQLVMNEMANVLQKRQVKND